MTGKKPTNCLRCPKFKEETACFGYCKKHRVSISISLAQKMRVCDDWEDEKVWLTVKEL